MEEDSEIQQFLQNGDYEVVFQQSKNDFESS
jgi:hypothetical protein